MVCPGVPLQEGLLLPSFADRDHALSVLDPEGPTLLVADDTVLFVYGAVEQRVQHVLE